jgi:hypothetical protein
MAKPNDPKSADDQSEKPADYLLDDDELVKLLEQQYAKDDSPAADAERLERNWQELASKLPPGKARKRSPFVIWGLPTLAAAALLLIILTPRYLVEPKPPAAPTFKGGEHGPTISDKLTFTGSVTADGLVLELSLSAEAPTDPYYLAMLGPDPASGQPAVIWRGSTDDLPVRQRLPRSSQQLGHFCLLQSGDPESLTKLADTALANWEVLQLDQCVEP